MTRRAILPAALSALVVAGPAAARAQTPPKPTQRAQATAVSPGLLEHFGVFRRAATPDDVVSSRAFDPRSTPLWGENPALARRVGGPTTGAGALEGTWLVPGTNALCVVAVPAAARAARSVSGCATSERQALRGVVGVAGGFGGLTGGLRRLYGAMPDGVRSVRVLGRRRELVRTIRVAGNAFNVVVRDARAVSYVVGGKRRTVSVAP